MERRRGLTLSVQSDDRERLTLMPARRSVGGWSVLGAIVIVAVVWIVVDSRGHPAAWVALAVAGSATAYFVLQLVAPGLFTLQLDSDGLRGRVLVRVEVAWADVQLARVRTIVGDPVLELYGTHGGTGTPRGVRVLLPVGADLDALHRFLAQRLGRSDMSRTDGAPAR